MTESCTMVVGWHVTSWAIRTGLVRTGTEVVNWDACRLMRCYRCTFFKIGCKSIKCGKGLFLSQVKCIFVLKYSFFDKGKRKQNIVICSFLNRYLLSDK